MVNFTCNHCGESLQKPRVEKHYQSTACRRNGISVSCMDCFKDFKLEEYVAHIKCITEEERYSAKGSVHAVKKGEVKQSTWVATVNSIIEEQINAKPGVKNLLEMISKHDNIPRKQTKFVNFVSSMSGGRANKKDITEVWSLLEAQKNAAKEETKNLEAAKTEQNKDKAKKRKSDDQTSEDATENSLSKKKKYKSDEATVANGVDKSKKKDKNKEVDKNSKKKHESDEAVAENGVDKTKKKRKNKEVDEHSMKKCENDEATAENGVNKSKKKRKNKKVDEHSIKKCENGVDKSKKKRKNKEADEHSIKKSENDDTATENGVKKSKKIRKNTEVKEESNAFCWKTAILEVVNKKEKLLTANQLKKEVFEKYEAAKGNIGIETKVAKTYNKKLKKLANIKIENDLVSLII